MSALPGEGARLDIDVGAVRRNWARAAASFTGGTLGAVVKCDAYGLGAGRLVPLLTQLGCRDFWVATVAEAAQLPAEAARIFVLNGLAGAHPAEFRRAGWIPVLASLDEVIVARAEAARQGGLPVAIQLDTGLGRLGLGLDEVRRLIVEPGLLDGLDLKLWVSHLGFFADPGHPANLRQRRRLKAWLARLPAAPVSLASSSGVFDGPDWHFDHARIGSALYGVNTLRERDVGLAPVASLSGPILRVAEVRAGAGVGYHGLYRAPARRRLATVGLGYADGVPQALGGRGTLLVAGHAAPIVGGIAMGLMSIDVSHVPESLAVPGARAGLYGAGQPLESVAALAGLTPNALLTATGLHVARLYRDEPAQATAAESSGSSSGSLAVAGR